MSAYVIIDSKSVNPDEAMDEYRQKAGATLKAHNGKMIAASTEIDAREGDWTPERMLIIEFPSIDAARAWYDSPEYQEVLPIRLRANQDKLVIVEGLG